MRSNGEVFLKVIMNIVGFLKRGLFYKQNDTCKRTKLYDRVYSGSYQLQWAANKSITSALVGSVRTFSSLTATLFMGALMCFDRKVMASYRIKNFRDDMCLVGRVAQSV